MPANSVIGDRCQKAATGIESDLQSLGAPDGGLRETPFAYPHRDPLSSYSYALEAIAALSATVVTLNETVTALSEKVESLEGRDQESLDQPQPKPRKKK